MDEATALPTCLTGPDILRVDDYYRWGDMLFLVEKRLTRKRSAWFVVTVAGDRSFWDGPHILPNAIRRIGKQCDYLHAVLRHVGALPPTTPTTVVQLLAEHSAKRWTEQQWERSWQAMSRRLMDAPADFLALAEVEALRTDLDKTFAAGDALAFAKAEVRLIQLCEQIAAREGIAPWWTIPPRKPCND